MMDTKLLRCPKCGRSGWFYGKERSSVTSEIIPADSAVHPPLETDRTLYWQIAIILFLYLGLWLYTLTYYFQMPELIAIKSNSLISMQDKNNLLLLPLIAGIFPVIELFTCRHAINEGLKSKIYWFITSLFAIILILFCGIQFFLIDFALKN
jgi:hypothetical protein